MCCPCRTWWESTMIVKMEWLRLEAWLSAVRAFCLARLPRRRTSRPSSAQPTGTWNRQVITYEAVSLVCAPFAFRGCCDVAHLRLPLRCDRHLPKGRDRIAFCCKTISKAATAQHSSACLLDLSDRRLQEAGTAHSGTRHRQGVQHCTSFVS